MSRGGRQRRQVSLPDHPQDVLRRLWKRTKYLLHPLFLNVPVLQFSRPVIVRNKPGPVPVDIQTLHLAARPGSDGNFLAIIPFETDTMMLVAPFSPTIVKYYADMLHRMPRQEQSRGSTGTDEQDDDEDDSDEEEITDDDDDGQLEQDEPAQGSKQERKDVDGSEKDISSDYNSSDYERLESDDIDDDPPELSDRDVE
ncbi:hypothetical protein Vretifemale_19100 [Volvox reticuliferus]|uniref:Uncharacterized protein n=1 Tax=Volvox reticuliferus TaxID=1737510 RepID=A0A8J4FV27_9CHLO|nr:hypothetical protein Vretifemale_19100 [Volvox reticuliferus]